MRFRSWSTTHNGAVRTHNEDRYVDRPSLGLWAVADGAGGHQAGEVASGMLADTLNAIPEGINAPELLQEVRNRVTGAHIALCEEAARRGPRTVIASTIVVLIARDRHFACLWAGDSRIYLLRDGALSQLTRDHSLVQELVESGAIKPEDAEGHPHANIITRAVGAEAEMFELDKVMGSLHPGDVFLLCSDGLTHLVTDEEIAERLTSVGLERACARLLELVMSRGASDNVTMVGVACEEKTALVFGESV